MNPEDKRRLDEIKYYPGGAYHSWNGFDNFLFILNIVEDQQKIISDAKEEFGWKQGVEAAIKEIEQKVKSLKGIGPLEGHKQFHIFIRYELEDLEEIIKKLQELLL